MKTSVSRRGTTSFCRETDRWDKEKTFQSRPYPGAHKPTCAAAPALVEPETLFGLPNFGMI